MSGADPILVWGAGAIGGSLGAAFIRAGETVVFVDRDEDHVAAVARRGLEITGPVAPARVEATATTPAALEGRFRRCILAVKSHHTAEAMQVLAPHVAEDGFVVSAQNGLNEAVIAAAIGPERTVGCFVNFGADYIGPGIVTYSGRGAVVVGELDGAASSRLGALHRLFQAFDREAVATPNISGYLWAKLIYGALLFATAVTDDSIADVLADERRRPLLTRLAREVADVSRAEGVRLEGFDGFRPRRLPAGCGSGAHPRLLRRHGGAQSPIGEVAFRHLARPRGPQTAYRGRCPARSRRRDRAPARGRDADQHRPDGVDPRDRGRDARPRSREPRRARAGRRVRIDLAGRRALVTGAGHGFGRAIAVTLADAGAEVLASDVEEDGLPETARLAGALCTVCRLDVTDAQAVAALAGQQERDGRTIDILVNNAGGVLGQVGRPIEAVPLPEWQAILDVNLTGAFLTAQAFAPAMKRKAFGRIVNISSGAGLGISLTGIQAYASAKAGQIGLTRQLAHEFGPFGITVNGVAPGFVRSNPTTERQWAAMGTDGQRRLLDGIALKRLGQPEDIAAAVLFFASDLGRWVTGQVLSVDGGK